MKKGEEKRGRGGADGKYGEKNIIETCVEQ